jgi:hypothetical protein
MRDLFYAFTIFLLTLGPIKVVAPFFLITHRNNQRTILLFALKSTIVATSIALFIVVAVVSTMLGWALSSVQAGLAVQLIIGALRRLHIIP